MKAVNLLPPDYSGLKRSTLNDRFGGHTVAVGGTAAAVVAVAALGFAWHSASSTASSKQAELSSLEAQLATVKKAAAPAGNGVQARLTQISANDATRVAWDGFMSRLARVLPEDVWLTGLITANTSTTAVDDPDRWSRRIHHHRLHLLAEVGRPADAAPGAAALAERDPAPVEPADRRSARSRSSSSPSPAE